MHKGNTNKHQQVSSKTIGAQRRIRLWMGLMVVFIGWAGYTYFSQAGVIAAESEQLEEAKESMRTSEQSMNQLKYEIDRLDDPEYIGQLAMKKYGLYKPGEIPVRVSEQE